MIHLKKYLIFSVVILMFFRVQSGGVLADEETGIDVMKTNTSHMVVSMDTIYKLRDEYSVERAVTFNDSRFLRNHSYRIVNAENNNLMQILVDDAGYADYECRGYIEGSLEVMPVYLRHVFTGEEIVLQNASEQELTQYFQRTAEIGCEIREKIKYVHQTFREEDYGGVYYDKSERKVCVYIINQELCQKLEENGISYREGQYSLRELYSARDTLWELRKDFGVNYMEVNPCTNRLDVYGCDSEGIADRIERRGISCCMVFQKVILHPGDIRNAEDIGNINTNDPEMAYFLYKKILRETNNGIKEGIAALKKEFPDYDCRNLLIRIVYDGNYERYLDFDQSLIDFVDTLPDYKKNEKNPVEEMMFGDPERMELKSQLREYKEIYPEMSYEEIYEKYLSDWEDITTCSREKKLYDLAINRQSGELSREGEVIQETEQKETSGTSIKRLTSIVVIIAGCLIIAVVREKLGLKR